MNSEIGFQLDLLGALRRRGMLIASVAGMVFLIAYWVAMALPNQYRASATLLVEPQAVNRILVQAGVGETDLNDRLHLMTAQILSRPRLSKVIDELGLYEDESRTMTRQEIIDLMREHVAVVPVLPELEATLRTRREIEINTFRVEFGSESPVVAAEVAQRLARDFIEQHVEARVDVSQKSLDFVSGEQERLSREIETLEARIAQVKGDNAGSLPEDLAASQRLLERTLTSIQAAERDLDAARSDEAFWTTQSMDSSGLGGAGEDTPAQRLASLELQLDSLRGRGFTDRHPDVISTIKEIDEVRATMANSDTRVVDEATLTPAQRAAVAQRKRAQQRIQNISLEMGRLEKEQQRIQASIERIPRVAEQLDALVRRHRGISENLRDANNRRLEAEVQADLERRQLGEQFRVLEPAFPPSEPSSPNRLVILVVGLMMGFSLGVAAAVVAESADSSVHGPQQLQTMVGMPVLASIPSILLPPDLAARRRRFLRNTLAAVGVIFFCLIGGALTYVVVNGATQPEPEVEEAARTAPVPGV